MPHAYSVSDSGG